LLTKKNSFINPQLTLEYRSCRAEVCLFPEISHAATKQQPKNISLMSEDAHSQIEPDLQANIELRKNLLEKRLFVTLEQLTATFN